MAAIGSHYRIAALKPTALAAVRVFPRIPRALPCRHAKSIVSLLRAHGDWGKMEAAKGIEPCSIIPFAEGDYPMARGCKLVEPAD